MGIVFALLSAVCWGFANVFARKAQLKGKTDKWSGLFITLIVNNLFNLVVFSVYLFFRDPAPYHVQGLLFFIAGGMLNSFIGRGLIFLSISRLGAPKAGVIKGFTPVFVLFGGVFLLGEVLDTADYLGIALALAGLMVVSLDMLSADRAQHRNTGVRGVSWQGILIGLLAALFLGSGNMCRKVGLTYIPDTILGVTIGGVSALVFMSLFLLITGRLKTAVRGLRNMDMSYGMSGLLAGFALLLLFLAFNALPISVANSFTASEPLFIMLASYLILKNRDKITWKLILGGALVISGAVILILV